VLKGRLSVHQPTIMCDGFVYEEGEDLDEEELEANAANLPKTLHSLPGVHCQMCIARCALPFKQCHFISAQLDTSIARSLFLT